MTSNERWILSEYWVAIDRFERFNEQLIEHRLRTPFAEVDLVFLARGSGLCGLRAGGSARSGFRSAGGGARGAGGAASGGGLHAVVVEVKTVSRDLGPDVISRAQCRRLEQARVCLEERLKMPTRLLLATVREGRGIRIGGSEGAEGGLVGPVIDYFEAPFR